MCLVRLVVVRPDRPARSVSHLLAVIEQLEVQGAYFQSLRDPIDTAIPRALFWLQVLGAVTQLERALIAERTKGSGRTSRGRVGGNSGLRAGEPPRRWPRRRAPGQRPRPCGPLGRCRARPESHHESN